MMCDDAGLLLHAYLDDELDAADSAAVARHINACAACKARYEAYAVMQKALSQPALYRRAPETLRAQWTTTPVPVIEAATSRPRRKAPLALAMAAGFVGALLLSTPAWVQLLQS